MLLNDLQMVNSSNTVSISIDKSVIRSVIDNDKKNITDPFTIQLEHALVFPGLINSHDHLDFNCFSPFGNRIYANYTEWGNHIHAYYKDEINAVLRIPLSLRTAWGMYKNLLAGVTTVVNHGDKLPLIHPLIKVCQDNQDLHSVKFQQQWKWKLNNPLHARKTGVVHAGEGTDEAAMEEIDELLKWNITKRKLVVVHGVAMNGIQSKKITGLVWCPESNRVLLDHHADIAQLKRNTCVVFGTDSTLTGRWNIWQHLRLARTLEIVNDAELFEMTNQNPARLWKLNKGFISEGRDADLVVSRNKRSNNWDSFFSIDPADILLVLQEGRPRLFDESLLQQLKSHIPMEYFSRIIVGDSVKYIEGNLPQLLRNIRQYCPSTNLPEEIHIPND